MLQNKRKVSEIFWVRTDTALVSKHTITPEEFNQVVRIEYEYDDGSRRIAEIKKRDN